MIAVLTACAVLAPAASAVVQHTAGGGFVGVTPRAGISLPPPQRHHSSVAPQALDGGSPSLQYAGGPVLHTTRPYLILWDPAHDIDDPTRALLSRYLSDTAGDDALGDDVYGVSRQYFDASGFAAAAETYVPAQQEIVDTTPFVSGCSPGVMLMCLTDEQLRDELQRLIAADGLPSGTGPDAPVYFMVTPATVDVCISSGECADDSFCAYHGDSITQGGHVLYAAIPLLNAVKACQFDNTTALQTPNGLAADVAVDNLSHEYNESITDPEGDAWYDPATGYEEADLCQEWGASEDPEEGADPDAYAPVLGGVPGGSEFDQLIGGDEYYTQSEWSNGAGDCELAPGGMVIPGFIVPPTIQAGVPTGFHAMPVSGAISSATWTFGDGTGAFSPGASTVQAHTYAAPGTYTVSLTEVDSRGQVGTATQTVTVPRPPVASFTQSASLAGTLLSAVHFDGSASSDPQPGAHIVSYRWDFGDNVTSFGPTAATSYGVPGEYTVSLTVISSDGLTATTTRPIRVEYVPGIHLAWENAYSVAGVPERFDGRPNPPGQSPVVTYHWDFGDGAKGSASRITHTYRHPGAYWVSLTLTTPDGLSRTALRRLTVKPAETITRLRATLAGAHAVLLKATVNGPGTLVIAGRRFTLAKAGSVSRVVSLTVRQRGALRARGILHLAVPVHFHPLAGRAITATAEVTITS